MKDFLKRSEKMIEDANVSIKEYNRMIKDYEEKGFFGKMFSTDPASHEAQIRSKKGVIDDIKEKTKTYPKEIKKCEAKIITFDKDLNEHKKVTKNKDRKKNESALKEYQDKIDAKGARLVEISNEIAEVKNQVPKIVESLQQLQPKHI